MKSYPVHAVNLRYRTDRRIHILSQFEKRKDFSLIIESAVECEIGAFSLWQTFKKTVKDESDKGSDYFIFCEDDHTFTENYTLELLSNSILQAQELKADLLSGGFSWFEGGLQINDHLFWVNKFNGMQFTVIFKSFYETILKADPGESVITDIYLSTLTDNKFVIYPYISIQKEFGYSDVTCGNGKEGYVTNLFQEASEQLRILNKVKCFYLS